MKHIELANGFACDLDENVMDDMEVFEAIVGLQNGDSMQIPTIMNKVLGANKKSFYDHIRTEDGRVPTADAINAITELITEFGKK